MGKRILFMRSDCGKSYRSIVRGCAGAAQFSISESEVGLVRRDSSDQLGSPRSPEESGVIV